MSARIDATFARLSQEGRCAFIPYLMGGDGGEEETHRRLDALVEAGADLIELGFPFTDPTADGPVIEEAGIRALKSGASLRGILSIAARFRERHMQVPLILMGYTNPVHAMGFDAFATAAAEAGVDGAIIVDSPMEEDAVLRRALSAHRLSLIRLVTPTTDARRLARSAQDASGFLYYVAQKGVTGGAGGGDENIATRLHELTSSLSLPLVVGFGISTPAQAAGLAPHSRGVVVGSALVQCFHEQGLEAAASLARELARSTHHPQGVSA